MKRWPGWVIIAAWALVMVGAPRQSIAAQAVLFGDGSQLWTTGLTSGQISGVQASGFTTLVLFSMSIDSSGNFNYGGQTICSNGNYVGPSNWNSLLNQCKAHPSTVTRIEMCIGGWGDASFQNVKNIIAAQGNNTSDIVYRNLAALHDNLPIDAICFDDESTYDSGSASTFGGMAGSLGMKVTLCPYTNSGYWAAVKSGLGSYCDYIYLQCYDGGAGNDPASWASALGVPINQIVPGYWDYERDTTFLSKMQGWKNEGCTGGFLWPSCSGCNPPAGVGEMSQYADWMLNTFAPLGSNCGFESPSIGSGAYQYSPSAGSWSFNGSSPNGSGIVANGSAFGNPNALEGTQAAFVQEYGGISQAISGFTPGATYTVLFLAAERPGNSQTWNLQVNGGNIASYNPGSGATGYQNYIATFTATSATQTIAFVGTDQYGGDNTVFIDSVRFLQQGQPVSNGVHTLAPVCAPGVRLDDYNLSTSNGSPVVIYQAGSGDRAEQWSFSNVAGNTYTIDINVGGPFCLDDMNGGSGTQVGIWTCNGGVNQLWTAIVDGSNYQLVNGNGLCLDDWLASSSNGGSVISYPCNASDTAQIWTVN
jgi:hypothetical protein